MHPFAFLKTDGHLSSSVAGFLKKLLTDKIADAVLVAAPTPYSSLPMPTLFTDPDLIEKADPLAPAAPFNSARQAVSVLKHETGKRIALVLRPCEIRALVELAKLKQCVLENTILIGVECLGRMENSAYLEASSQNTGLTQAFYDDPDMQKQICASCAICTRFQPVNADISLCVIGMPVNEAIGLSAETEAGLSILKQLGFETSDAPEGRKDAAGRLLAEREIAKAAAFEATREKTDSIEKFQRYFADCLNCHNCRVACPVCYCRECVFLTDVFAHDPEVLLRRASKKGMVKLPTDTTMFHMTRMAHMAHACVACGHCSSVCPSHIPVADVFIRVANEIQNLYAYEPGRDMIEPIPLLVFDEAGKEGV
ncbi:MAG: formate dehydrogenase [Desulfobacterales bacterium CG23_combo_of_CG06-09_8_20_14_all_51_8]|nr:MAG: formate dehydrogenase [Desulfobacterales bacterium CG23_combo_of_CG06-09_8_20_14_all_51_8]